MVGPVDGCGHEALRFSLGLLRLHGFGRALGGGLQLGHGGAGRCGAALQTAAGAALGRSIRRDLRCHQRGSTGYQPPDSRDLES